MVKKTRLSQKKQKDAGSATYIDVLLSAFGGALFALSLPKVEIFILAWVCLVPLFFAIRGKRLATAFLLGLVFGVVAFIGILYWTVFPISMYGGMSIVVAIIYTLLLISYVALYSALFAASVSWSRERFNLSIFISAPVSLVALDYIRSFFITGFPWGFIGHSQLPWLTFMQILDITGVYGVSFVVVAANAALFLIIERIIKQSNRFPLKETAASVSLVVILIVYGVFAINREHRIMKSSPVVSVCIVQPNIRQDLKWDPTYQEDTMKIYEDMTIAAGSHSPKMVIWPETATPFFFQNNPIYRPRVEELTRRIGSNLFFGTPGFEDDNGTIRYYNRAYVMSRSGAIIGSYDKIHLLPFAEYIPLRKYLFFINKLANGAIGDFSQGTNTTPIDTDIGPVGSLICYEAVFPESARVFARKGAAFLVIITNDAWFGTTSAPYQHFALARMRAIETRLFMIRSANTGISAVIDPTGNTEIKTDIFTRTIALGEIAPKSRMTFYTRFGDIFAQIVTFLFFLPLIIHYTNKLLKRKR